MPCKPKKKSKKKSKTNYVYIQQKGKGKLSHDMILTMKEYQKGVKRHRKW